MTAGQDDDLTHDESDGFTDWESDGQDRVWGLDSVFFLGVSESYTAGEWGTARLELSKEYDTPVQAEAKLSVPSGVELESGGSEAVKTVELPADGTTVSVEWSIRVPETLTGTNELTCSVTYWSEGSREEASSFDGLASYVNITEAGEYTPEMLYDSQSDDQPEAAGLNELLSSLGDRFDNVVVGSAVRAFSSLRSLTLVHESRSDSSKKPVTVHAAELVVRALTILLGVSAGVFGLVRRPDLFLSHPLAPDLYAAGPSLVWSVLAGASLVLLVVWSQATTFAWPGAYGDERRGLTVLTAVVAVPAIVVVPTTVGYAVALLVCSNLALSLTAAIVR